MRGKRPPKTRAKIRVQKITQQGGSTHFWRRFAPPEMGGESLRRYFLDAYFSKGFWGAFHAFLQIVFISRSPLYIEVPAPRAPTLGTHCQTNFEKGRPKCSFSAGTHAIEEADHADQTRACLECGALRAPHSGHAWMVCVVWFCGLCACLLKNCILA